MTAKLQDQKESWLNELVYKNIFFKYLPMAEVAEGQPVEVGRIYFATDEPLKSARNNGKRAFAEILESPSGFLTEDDKKALENLVRPIDGGYGGSRTRDPAESMSKPANAHSFAKAMQYISFVTWSFVARADPREPSSYNVSLAAARARAIVGYLMKYVWNGYEKSQRSSDYSTAISKLLKAFGPPSYSKQDWWNEHIEPIGTKHQWRGTLMWNVFVGLVENSRIVGDDGRDPGDVDDDEYPELRRVEIKVNSKNASADHDWTTDCSVMEKKPKFYNADKDDELPPVVYPPYLYDFDPETQSKGRYNVRKKFKNEVNHQAGKFSKNEIDKKFFAEALGEIVYGYRWLRMAQHELFRGHLPAAAGMGPGQTNPGTEPTARNALCGGGVGTLKSLHGDMISSDLGNFVFGGNPYTNSEGLKTARQIAHQHYVRIDPFYRVAYMKEIPGTKPADSWDLDGKATPPEEVKLWPPQNDIEDVWLAVRGELNPKKWGEKSKVTPEDDPEWGNGIPKVLGEDATGGPVGYMGGEEHYQYLANNGQYRYDSFGYMDSGLDIVKKSQRKKLANQYQKKNDSSGTQPFIRNVRGAIKEAQEMMKSELSTSQYSIYLKKRRNPYPDYTKRKEWNRWKDPANDPYTSK
jgi:hypothetical protein